MPPAQIRIAAASSRKRSRKPTAAVRKKRAVSLKKKSVAPKPARSVQPSPTKKMLAPPPLSVAHVASVPSATPRVAMRAALRPAPARTVFLATVGLPHADPAAPYACVPMPIVRAVRVDRVRAVPAARVPADPVAQRVPAGSQAIVRAVLVDPARVDPAADRVRSPRSIPMI